MPGDVFSTALLAAVVTKLVDLVRKFDTGTSRFLLVLSIIFGVAIALTWQVNTLGEIGIESATRLQGIAGQLLTGALIGGFGSGWHEVFDALSSAAKGSRAKAELPLE